MTSSFGEKKGFAGSSFRRTRAEELRGIVNSPVLFDFLTYELQPKGKEDLLLQDEHKPDNISDCNALQSVNI